jgi:type IV secretion system protein VirB3
MMTQLAGVQSHTLFLALVRPPMMMGVLLDVFFINIILAMLAFLLSGNLFFALIWLPLHAVSALLCQLDTQAFKVFFARAQLGRTENQALWGGQSYEPY